MDKELIMILVMTLSGLLFALGGWKVKSLRRFGIPVLLYPLLVLYGILWWKALLAMIVLCVVLHLGYGERTPYWLKFLVGCSYVFPSFIVTGYNYWQIILPVGFFAMFVLSNTPHTEKDFPWKAVEFLTGAMIGVSLII